MSVHRHLERKAEEENSPIIQNNGGLEEKNENINPSNNHQRRPSSWPKQRNQTLYFIFYKYFIGAVAVYEAFVFLANLFAFLPGSLRTKWIYLSQMILSGYTAYQLSIEYLAIHQRDGVKAQKAVILIKRYMIVLPFVILFYSVIHPPLSEGQQSVISDFVFILGEIISAVGSSVLVWIFYLYGALQVNSMLNQRTLVR